MFNQQGPAVNEKPQVVGCWAVFTHANVAVETGRVSVAPEGIKIGVHLPGELRRTVYEEVLQAQ
jgi:hypothetical protein